MAKTKRDLENRERMIELFKDLKARKINDDEIVAGVAGILGLSYRTIYEHYKSWKAQKKIGSIPKRTLRDKIKEITNG